MSKDSDLEKIKKGEGLKESNTSNSNTSGIASEQRGTNSGIRMDQFTLDSDKKK